VEAELDALDGNAVGGLLFDVYGVEMTAATATCASCGDARALAEAVVYLQAPGTVLRCRHCGSVLLVVVERAGVACVDGRGVAVLT